MKLHRSWILLTEIVAAIFVFLFLYTALHKFQNLLRFEESLNESPVIRNIAPILSWAVPSLEFALVILLIWPRTRMAGLTGSTSLMFLFSLYVAYMIHFVDYLPCSCGGIISDLNWRQHLMVNSALTVLGIISIVIRKKLNGSDRLNPVMDRPGQ